MSIAWEKADGNGSDEQAVCAAFRHLVHLRDSVGFERVHRGVRADRAGGREFCFGDVEPDNVQAGGNFVERVCR